MKKISDKCLNLVKEFEGCKLTAYRDEVGVWTIGYGITNAVEASQENQPIKQENL